MSKNEFDNLAVRAEDLCRRCEKQFSPVFTDFLSPEEQVLVKSVAGDFAGVFCVEFGGFDDAERKIVGFFPLDVYKVPETEQENVAYFDMFDVEYIRISGSGFVNIGHRDVLGSLMALGLKRGKIGDILVDEDGKSAYVVLLPEIAGYVCVNLERVARDKVKVVRIDKADVPEKKQKFADMSLTVSSLRLDALCSGFMNISRDKAKKLIASGRVSVNHSECTSVDKTVAEGDIITAKGVGKFKIDAFLGMTAKDRHKVVVRKYL